MRDIRMKEPVRHPVAHHRATCSKAHQPETEASIRAQSHPTIVVEFLPSLHDLRGPSPFFRLFDCGRTGRELVTGPPAGARRRGETGIPRRFSYTQRWVNLLRTNETARSS